MAEIFTIAGMHRSGTSLVANWFHDSDIFVGFDLLEAASSNQKGHFEDLDFLELHKKDLRDKNLHETGLLIDKKPEWIFTQENQSAAADLIKKRKDIDLWGWKEPRSTLYLDQWKDLAPNLKVISIYREPSLVIDSLYRRLKRNKWYYTRNPYTRLKWFLDIDHNPKKWYRKFSEIYTLYNKSIIDFHEKFPEDSLIISLADLLNNENNLVSSLEAVFGHKLNMVPFSTVYEKELMKDRSDPLILSQIGSSIEVFDLMENLKGY